MKNIGLIGKGFVGSAIAAGFGLHANVRVYDKNPKNSMHSLEETVNKSDFVFVGVPTPMQTVDGGSIDLTIMDSVFHDINKASKNKDTIFIIKSTVVPGTTDRYKNLYPEMRIVFNPEFLTERAANLDFINTTRIVLGGNNKDVEEVANLYRDRFPYTKIVKTDTQSAEFIKYMCNCFFATKISFMNEMYLMAEKADLDWKSVMEGFITDGRIGNSHIDVPGHDGDRGFGGKCFPKDINAFIGYFEENNVDPIVMKSAWERNKTVRSNIDWSKIKGAVSEKSEN